METGKQPANPPPDNPENPDSPYTIQIQAPWGAYKMALIYWWAGITGEYLSPPNLNPNLHLELTLIFGLSFLGSQFKWFQSQDVPARATMSCHGKGGAPCHVTAKGVQHVMSLQRGCGAFSAFSNFGPTLGGLLGCACDPSTMCVGASGVTRVRVRVRVGVSVRKTYRFSLM